MNAQQLKNSILQMAVQGKLVPQDSNDEPASVLLERIRKEKEKLIKEGKIKKEKISSYIFSGEDNLPYEKIGNKEPVCIADEVPFEIPDSWEWVRLGKVISIFGRIGFRGYTKNDMVKEGNGAITISPSNIKGMDTFFTNNTYISWAKYEESPEIMIHENDLLLVKTGSSYGKCGIVKDLPEKATINPQLVVLKNILIDRYYLLYALNSPLARKQYEEFVIGTSIPTFSQEKLASLLLPIPPIKEQKRITDKIGELISCISQYDEVNKKIYDLQTSFPELLKKSIVQQAVMGKLVPQDPNDEPASDLLPLLNIDMKIQPNEPPFDIPDSWLWMPIGNLGASIGTDSFSDGPFGSNLKTEHYIDKPEVRIIQLSNIGKDGWKNDNVKYTSFKHLEEVIPRCEVQPGDFVIAKMMPAGRTIEVPDLGTRIALGSDAMKFVPNSVLNKKYLLYAMSSQVYLDQVYSKAHGITRVRTTLRGIKSYVLPIPPLKEQIRIVAELDALLPCCEKLY